MVSQLQHRCQRKSGRYLHKIHHSCLEYPDSHLTHSGTSSNLAPRPSIETWTFLWSESETSPEPVYRCSLPRASTRHRLCAISLIVSPETMHEPCATVPNTALMAIQTIAAIFIVLAVGAVPFPALAVYLTEAFSACRSESWPLQRSSATAPV